MTSTLMMAAVVAALSHPGLLPIDPPKEAAVVGTVASVSQARPYEALLCSHPAWDCAKAYRVMLCESGGNPRAYSDGNYGLLQVNAIHAGRVGGNLNALFDPEVNVDIAYGLWVERGWQPWQYCSAR